MAFNDIYKLAIHMRMFGQEIINKLHFVDQGIEPINRSQQLADLFRTQMDTTMRGRAVGQLLFEFIEVQRIVPFGDGPSVSNYPANTAGTNAGAGNGNTTTIAEVITVHTGGAGRRKRGRMFLTGIPDAYMLQGGFHANQTNLTRNFATALVSNYINVPQAALFYLGVWSRATAGPTPPWSTDAFTRATALTVRTTQRNQRRRQLGVGR